MTRALLLFVGTLIAAPAFAQDDGGAGGDVDSDSGRQIKYKERTEIDFEGVDVTGELVKPQGTLLLDRRKANFNPLIKLRENWNEEMKQSVDEIK
ncbi:MAG: hypothetical protein R3F59_01535 [Myxococcota bacterium]